MDAFEKWKPVNGYGGSSLDAIAEQAFRAGMRAAAEIAQTEVDRMLACQSTPRGMRDDMTESINTNIRMMASSATTVKDAILAEADK